MISLILLGVIIVLMGLLFYLFYYYISTVYVENRFCEHWYLENMYKELASTSLEYNGDGNVLDFLFKLSDNLVYHKGNKLSKNSNLVSLDNIGWVLKTNYANYVVFKGTTSVFELSDSINMYQTKFDNNLSCHYGYQVRYNKIKKSLFMTIDSRLPIFCFGHSMGGGVASIFHYDCYQNRGLAPKTWAVASPRTCNFNSVPLSKESKQTYTNLYNTYDLVHVCIPPILDYRGSVDTYDLFPGITKELRFNYKCTEGNHALISYYTNFIS